MPGFTAIRRSRRWTLIDRIHDAYTGLSPSRDTLRRLARAKVFPLDVRFVSGRAFVEKLQRRQDHPARSGDRGHQRDADGRGYGEGVAREDDGRLQSQFQVRNSGSQFLAPHITTWFVIRRYSTSRPADEFIALRAFRRRRSIINTRCKRTIPSHCRFSTIRRAP